MSKNNVDYGAINKNVDLFWDNWLEGVKKFNMLQADFEKRTFQTFNHFEQLFQPTNELLENTKEKSLRLTKEINEQLKKSVDTLLKESDKPVQLSWLNQIEEISNQTEQLFWTSNKTLFDFVTKSQEEAVKTIELLVQKQRKERKEILEKITDLIDDIKKVQKSVTTIK